MARTPEPTRADVLALAAAVPNATNLPHHRRLKGDPMTTTANPFTRARQAQAAQLETCPARTMAACTGSTGATYTDLRGAVHVYDRSGTTETCSSCRPETDDVRADRLAHTWVAVLTTAALADRLRQAAQEPRTYKAVTRRALMLEAARRLTA